MTDAVAESTERPFKVLVVEDDAQISRVLKLELEHEGYQVDVAFDGLAGLESALKEPDLVILDLMLPKMDGVEVCKRLRAKSRVPIIMLTAKDRIPDRVGGLDAGADDYLTKPFAIEELLARVRARLRERHPKSNVLTAKDLVMDRDRHEVTARRQDDRAHGERVRPARVPAAAPQQGAHARRTVQRRLG